MAASLPYLPRAAIFGEDKYQCILLERASCRDSTDDDLHMSVCSRRYASKSVQTLNRLHLAPACPTPPEARQPLLFLYPKCFRHALSRQYHTGPELGQGHAKSIRDKTPCRMKEKESRRYLSPSPASRAQSRVENPKRSLKASAKTRAKPAARGPDEETVLTRHGLLTGFNLHQGPRKRHVPTRISFRKAGSEVDQKVAHYLQDVDAEAHFLQFSALIADDREPQVTSNLSRHELSTSKVRRLCGSSGPNMWIYHDGNGCIVRVRPGGGRSRCQVELEGTERARDITLQYLKGSEAYVTPKAEMEWMKCARTFSPYSDIRDLPHPPRWTVRTFRLYVDALASPHDYRSAMRYVHQGTEHRHRIVGHLLERVFSDTSTTLFASTGALQIALRFCRQHTELSDTAKHIWQSAHILGLQPEVSCFNTELSRCLIVKDFNRYNNLLLTMRAKGARPDSTTFSLILRYAEDPDLRSRILSVVEHAHLTKAQRPNPSITHATIKQEVDHYLRGRHGFILLNERMTKTFGANWLTTRNVERLLRACRIRKANTVSASDVLEIVQKAVNCNVSLDVRCMTELFHIAKKAGNLEDAIEILKSRPMQQIQGLSQDLLESFFLVAWQKRHFNLCRLIWFHAATQGRITRDMQILVQRSLKRNVRAGHRPGRRAWLLLAGKIIVNANLKPEQARTMFPRLAQHDIKSSAVEWLLQWTADSGARHEQMQLSHLLLEQDLHAWRFNEPLRHHDFLLLLDKAMVLDNEWRTTDVVGTIPPVDLLCRSLELPIRRRPEPIIIPSTNTHSQERRQDFAVNDHKLSYDTFVPLNTEDKVDIVDHLATHVHRPADLTPSAVDDITEGDLQVNQAAAASNHYKLEKARRGPDGPQIISPLVEADEEPSKVFHHAVYAGGTM